MSKSIGLSVGGLLEQIYEILEKTLVCREIKFPGTVRVEIADDSDYHRNRTGYMCYDSVILFKNNGKTFIIGRGKACGQYPADPYNGDIMVLEFPMENIEIDSSDGLYELKQEMIRNDYFSSSVIVGMSDGRLIPGRKKISSPINISEFIVQNLEINEDVINMDGIPMIRKPVRYKQALAKIIANSIKGNILLS